MSEPSHARAEELFLRAIELPRGAREDWLRREAGQEPGLREEVLSLLSHHDSADRFLAVSALHPGHERPALERIGEFEILGVLGEGGMGIVYLARQANPRRLVALKVANASAASSRARKRLAHEAHLLGKLEHPSIARIYEAGTGGPEVDWRPYFAMEYVRGPTITEYATQSAASPRERLKLLADVCDAVAHAHQHGIVHRDLKPSNILVESTPDGPRVKVLDFGIARATDSDVQTVTMLTDAGQIVGTLSYMSPEQASGESAGIDARSDVYSLGVLGYELLCGRLPHDLSQKHLHEAVRILRDEDPTPVTEVRPALRGDVATMIEKALEREPDRRYSGAREFSADIRRWLGHLPIEARPPSRAYRLVKFTHRHRAVVLGTLAVFVALTAGIIGTTTQMVRAERERDRLTVASALAARRATEAELLRAGETEMRLKAERALRRAEVLAEFQRQVFESPDATRRGRDVRVIDVLGTASQRIGRTFAAEPDLEIEARATLADTFRSLGWLEESALELERASELCQTTRGSCAVETLRLQVLHAAVLKDLSRYPESRRLLDIACERLAELEGEDGPDALVARLDRAVLRTRQGEREEGEADARAVLSARSRAFGDRDVGTIAALTDLGSILSASGKAIEAESMLRTAVERSRDLLGDRHPDTLSRHNALANYMRQRGQAREAETEYRFVLAMRRDVQGDRHYDTLTAMNNLGGVLQDLAQHEEAESLFRETLAIRLEVLGEDHRDTLVSMNNLALLLAQSRRLDEAEQLHLRALGIKRRVLGERDSSTITTVSNLALVRYLRGDVAGALESYRDVLAASEAVHGPRHLRTGQARENVGGCLLALRRFEEAEAELTKAFDILNDVQGPTGKRTIGVAQRLVDLYEAWARPEQAGLWRARLKP